MANLITSPPYGTWTVRTTNYMPIKTKTRKTKRETEKHFRGLKWSDEAHYCDSKGRYVTKEQIAKPDYDPWIIASAEKIANKGFKDGRGKVSTSFLFLYQPSTSKILWRKVMGEYRRIKSGRLVHKRLLKEIDRIKPKIFNAKIPSGYIYAPYIPMYVTPNFIDPNDFSLRKGIRTRYGKRMAPNKKFHKKILIK